MRLNRRPTLHTTAGVTSSDYWEFQPGQKVMTREGVIGTVEAVNDGPFPGSEEYEVVLDGGLGGGAYSAGELGPVSDATTALRATQARLAGIPGTADPMEHWEQDEQDDAERAAAKPKKESPGLPGLPEGAGAEDEALALAAALQEHLASDDYPELGTILYDRPPIERQASLNSVEAGVMDFLFHPVRTIMDHLHGGGAPEHQDAQFDWCRFRSGGHCYYPKQLDEAATHAAGYAVWVPENRGPCPRLTTFTQQMCPVGAPGPHSGDPHALPEATQGWNQGGQRGGHAGEEGTNLAPYRTSAMKDADTLYSYASQDEDSIRSVGEMGSESDPSEWVFDQYGDPIGGSTQGEVGSQPRSASVSPGVGEGTWTGSRWNAPAPSVRNNSVHPTRTPRATYSGPTQHEARRIAEGVQEGGTPVYTGEYADDQNGTRLPNMREGARQTSGAQIDEELRFHFTSSWRDVQAKAKRIRSENGVRIISTPDGRNPYITAEVNGDENVYQTTILRTMGGKSVAAWECGCAWSSYSWGRTGQWKKYEGRMCSHALATVYQAQADEMFGGRVKEIGTKPIWSDQIKQPGSWNKDKGRHTSSLPATEKCKYCKDQATQRLLWAEGMAYIPVCNQHQAKARNVIEHDNNDEVLGVTPIQSQGAYTFDVDFSHSKDHLKNGEVVSGTHRVSTDGGNETEARLLAEQMVAATGREPTKVRRVSLHAVNTDADLQAPPIQAMASALLSEGEDTNEVLAYLVRMGTKNAVGMLVTAMNVMPFKGTVGGQQFTFVDIMGDSAVTDAGDRHPMDQIEHADFDPHSGLDYHEAKVARNGDVVSPGYDPKNTPNAHATQFEHLPKVHQDQIAKNVSDNSPDPENRLTHESMVQHLVDHVHRAAHEVPGAIKEGVNWYRGAHQMTKDWGEKYGMSHHAAAGVTASMSPNCSWESNVTGAHYMIRHLGANNHLDHEGDGVDRSRLRLHPAHVAGDFSHGADGTALKAPEQEKAKADFAKVAHLGGKKFHDMDTDEAASAIRYQAQHVDGLRNEIGAPKKGKGGGMSKTTFTYGDGMRKAVRIARGEHPDQALGGHKVRSFYNNIIDPHNKAGQSDVTMDSHAISAASNAKFSGGAMKPIFDTAGKGEADRQKTHNAKGTYSMFASAYREAHHRLVGDGTMPKDSQPADTQAVVWNEWKRQMEHKSNKNKGNAFPVVDEKTGRIPGFDKDGNKTASRREAIVDKYADEWLFMESSAKDPEEITHLDLHPIKDEPEDHSHQVIDPMGGDDEEPDPDVYPEENAEWHREHDGDDPTTAGPDDDSKHTSVLQLIADMMMNEDPYPLQGGEAGGQLVNGVLPWGPDEWTGGDSGRPDETDNGDDDDVTRGEVQTAGDGMADMRTAAKHGEESTCANCGNDIHFVQPYDHVRGGWTDEGKYGEACPATKNRWGFHVPATEKTANSHEDERKKHKHSCPYCHGIGCNLCGFLGFGYRGDADGDNDGDGDSDSDDPGGSGVTSDLHDEPEPALPETDGAEDDDIKPGDPKLSWLQGGGTAGAASDNHEIAERARQTVAKLALKNFTQAERAALIGEGDGTVVASNLDALDITGTHYEALEASLSAADEEDDQWLS